jgi:hypothetical protein
MIPVFRRFQEQVVKVLLFTAALASIVFDRLCPGGDVPELITAASDPSPQQMLVKFVTIMIAGSLSMLALGYSSRA